MFKKTREALILTLLIIGCYYTNAQTQALKIGVVDLEVIVKEMPEAQEANNKLIEIGRSYQDTLINMQKELEERFQKYQKQRGMMPAEQQQKEEEALNNLNMQIRQYQEQVFGTRGVLNQLQDKLLEPIRKKVKTAIEKVAKEEKMSFVFDKSSPIVMYAEEKFDLTYRVLDVLKRGNSK